MEVAALSSLLLITSLGLSILLISFLRLLSSRKKKGGTSYVGVLLVAISAVLFIGLNVVFIPAMLLLDVELEWLSPNVASLLWFVNIPISAILFVVGRKLKG